jgi:hypothetical protein
MLFFDEQLIESRKAEQPMPFERIEQEEATGFADASWNCVLSECA